MNKFRVWDAKLKKYINSGEYPVGSEGWIVLLQDGELGGLYATYEYDTGAYIQFTNLGDCIVEYSTGLTDKNGKEIFEGDIIRNTIDDYVRDMEVVWLKSSAGFGFVIDDLNIRNGDDLCEVEVIGNIHEVKHE